MAESLAACVIRLRTERGWTPSELARRSGLSRSLVCQLEQESGRHPRANTLTALADTFGVTVDAVLGRKVCERVRCRTCDGTGWLVTTGGRRTIPLPRSPLPSRHLYRRAPWIGDDAAGEGG